jgi:demethylmenaquinone methyltransferase/2-methoxy-6-polyprenyl-1,4-benzoquinol methylase
LDIATGTGDLVLALAKLKTSKIIGLDISPGMLSIGKEKVVSKCLENRINMMLGDSESLKFDDAYFDVVTVAFGVRNFENLEKGLQEINRVLKPKGVLVILETAVPKNQILKSLYTFYTQNIVPFMSTIFFKDHSAYQYLSDFAANFQCGEAFNNILRENGFIDVDDFPQTLGVSSIYFAKKS